MLVIAHLAPKVHINRSLVRRHAHPVLRHQTVRQENIDIYVDTQQECKHRDGVISAQVMITVMPGPWTVAQIVDHVQAVNIEKTVA